MSEDTHNYEVTFYVTMPGQSKASSYKINVRADSKVEALARAEDEYQKIVLTYDPLVKEIRDEKVSSRVIEA